MNARPLVPYLFSVDLEDVRNMIPNGHSYRAAVPECTDIFLRFLKSHGSTCTFFVVGDMLRTYPDLIHRIVDEGHEIACHTDSHTPLDELGADGLRIDIEKWIKEAASLGITEVVGFRAPILSLTQSTSWAYEVLTEFGFKYSSSVLPAKSPLYGWPEFPKWPCQLGNIIEVPLNLVRFGPLNVPFGGGVYFRCLPWFVLKRLFQREQHANNAVAGYFHPYDVDTSQERFMHPGLSDSRFLNALMFIGRGGVERKLRLIHELGFEIMRYDEFVSQCHVKKGHS